jgi:hypothetical protein
MNSDVCRVEACVPTLCREIIVKLSTLALVAKPLYNFPLGLSAICHHQGLGSLTKPLLPRRLVNHNACLRSIVARVSHDVGMRGG